MGNSSSPKLTTCKDKSIALLLAIFNASLLVASSPHIGLTLDESTYFVAAETYPSWYDEFITQPHFAFSEGDSEAYTVFSKDLLHFGTFNETDYVIIQYQQSGFYRAMREWMDARELVYEYKYRRLRLAEVYVQ